MLYHEILPDDKHSASDQSHCSIQMDSELQTNSVGEGSLN